MCDVPYGVLLSGGLDSSLVASVMTRLLRVEKVMNGTKAKVARVSEGITNGLNGTVVLDCLKRPDIGVVHSFSIGLPGSPDLKVDQKQHISLCEFSETNKNTDLYSGSERSCSIFGYRPP